MNRASPTIAVFSVASLLAFGVGSVSGGRLDVVAGVVQDGAGSPVSSARVELLDGSRLLTSAWTDRDGAFRLSTGESWGDDWVVRVERLGFATREVDVPGNLSLGPIVLLAAPLPIPGVEARAERDICSTREDASARRLWEASARLYRGGLDTLGIGTYSEVRTDTLTGEDPRSGETTSEGTVGQRTSASLLRLNWTRRVERDGYAFAVRRSDRERSYDSWSYAPLEAHFAPHFADPVFGRLHEFHREGGPDGMVLTFCGTRTNRPYLEGALELGPDTLIRRAEWRFMTPDPDEAAGGWARFDPASDQGRPFLLPRESLTWLTLPDGEVVRRAEWYDGWITAPGDSVPFLSAPR